MPSISFKKITTLGLILTATTQFTSAQKIRTLFQGEDLSGKVKQITEVILKKTEKPGGGTSTDSLSKTIYNYDATGNITERLDYRAFNFGDRKTVVKFTYQTKTDSKGIKTQIALFNPSPKGIYKFNEKGFPIEFDGFKTDGSVFYKEKYFYDKQERLSSNKHYNTNDGLVFERKLRYSTGGNVISEDIYKGDRKLSYSLNYIYEGFDKMGNWVKRSYSGKFANGSVIKPQIAERRISYY